MTRILAVTTLYFLLMLSSAFASPINWVSWELVSGGAAGTVLQDGVTVDVAYAGDTLGLTEDYYWNEGIPAPYTGNSVVDNAPSSGISLYSAGFDRTISFSQALIDPVFALYSVGAPDVEVIYEFDQPFTLLSEGDGNWGDGSFSVAGNVLSGFEGHGVIQFIGEIESISWNNPYSEHHHGFALGVIADTSPVPEPSTILLLVSGLIGLAWYGRKRKNA